MNDDCKCKDRGEPIIVKRMTIVVLLILLAGALVLVGVFASYSHNFNHLPISFNPGDWKLSTDAAVWGQFGDFIGGTANPILSFLTIVLLAVTLILQSRELELSRQELKETRDQLEKAADAQKQSEKALRAQAEAAGITAKLTAINALMEYYDKKIEKQEHFLSKQPRPNLTHEVLTNLISAYSAAEERLNQLRAHRSNLEKLLDQYYLDLTSVDEKQ